MSNASKVNATVVPVFVIYSKSFTVWMAMSLTASVITTITGTLLLVAIFRKGLRVGSQLLVANVILLELIVGAVFLPVSTLTSYVPHLRMGDTACGYFYFATIWIPNAAQWASFVLAVNRVNAFYFPHYYSIWKKKRFTGGVIVVNWMMMFALACCFIGRLGATGPWPTCGVLSGLSVIKLGTALTTVGLYVPLAGTCCCYLVLFLRIMWRRLRHRSQIETAAVSKSSQERRSLMASVLISSCLVSLICFLPMCITTTFFVHLFAMYPPLLLWVKLMYYMGYAGNSVVMLALGKEFRAQLRVSLPPMSRNRKIRGVNFSVSNTAARSRSGTADKGERSTGL